MLPDNPDTGHPRVKEITGLIHMGLLHYYCATCARWLGGVSGPICRKCEEAE